MSSNHVGTSYNMAKQIVENDIPLLQIMRIVHEGGVHRSPLPLDLSCRAVRVRSYVQEERESGELFLSMISTKSIAATCIFILTSCFSAKGKYIIHVSTCTSGGNFEVS